MQVGAFKPSHDDVMMETLNDKNETVVEKVRQGIRKGICFQRELVRNHTKPGHIVLELAAGSAPVTRACIMEGRIALAIERDEPIVKAVEAHMVDFKSTVISTLPVKLPKMKKKGTIGSLASDVQQAVEKPTEEEEEPELFGNDDDYDDVIG
jgi:hypothetical protein